jgi:hypothetical protein
VEEPFPVGMRASAMGLSPNAVDVSEEFWTSLPATH